MERQCRVGPFLDDKCGKAEVMSTWAKANGRKEGRKIYSSLAASKADRME